ncbi:MAG: PqqD family protein, partial [Candidatus Aminicenantes bacterium]|nr:PqqD family protein [Candidatus Aminicenantes bacterium]
INSPDVVFELFEDETVLINLENGNYYSVNGTGTDVLTLIKEEHTGEEIISILKNKYDSSAGDIASMARTFISELYNENLIRQKEKTGAGKGPLKKKKTVSKNTEEPKTFSTPQLNKYTDMQELLLLDMIQDIDKTGWPKGKPGKT